MSTDIPNPDAPGSEQPEPEFTRLPDLASRALGGNVVWANDESGRADLVERWFNLLPEGHAKALLAEDAGLSESDAEKAVANRPAKTLADLPAALRNSLAG
jgi:hypothetical protein